MMQYDDNLTVCPECGYDERTLPEVSYYLKPGTALNDRYLIGEAIGCGGFGITYVGWDNLLDRKVAIKEYYPNGVVTRDINSSNISITGATKAEFYHEGVEKFLTEAKVITKFSDFSNIVQIYDYLEENNTAYIIMEYIDGVTLEKYLDSHEGSISQWSEAVSIATDILGALEIVHANGIIHRDISPANIMISNDGTVKLLDFGAARQFVAGKTQDMSVIIKKGYAPIEQYKSNYRQDERSDLYSLGAVLYRMTTGAQPVDALNRITKDKLKYPRDINKNIPQWLESLILQAMNTNAFERPANATELKKALEAEKSQNFYNVRLKKKIIIVLIAVVIAAGLVLCLAMRDIMAPVNSKYYIDLPGTIDLHENEQCNAYVDMYTINSDDKYNIPDDYSISADISDNSIADLKTDKTLHELTISAKKTGKTVLTIDTPYATKILNINVKKDEKTYPETSAESTVLTVGKDIPAGEYVAFAMNCRGNISLANRNNDKSNDNIWEDLSFNYNYYVNLAEGEIIKLDNAYLVPEDTAQVDSSADGMFKVGKDIEEGEYKTLPQGRGITYTVHDINSFSQENYYVGKTGKKIYLSYDDNRYIYLENMYIKKCKNKDSGVSKYDKQQWKFEDALLNGKSLSDYYNEGNDKERVISSIAGDNEELRRTLLAMNVVSPSITIWKNDRAKFLIPCGDVKKIDEELRIASLGSGSIVENEEGNYTFTIENPGCIGKNNPQTVNQKGATFNFEVVSDTELHFYYDYYDMVLVFKR